MTNSEPLIEELMGKAEYRFGADPNSKLKIPVHVLISLVNERSVYQKRAESSKLKSEVTRRLEAENLKLKAHLEMHHERDREALARAARNEATIAVYSSIINMLSDSGRLSPEFKTVVDAGISALYEPIEDERLSTPLRDLPRVMWSPDGDPGNPENVDLSSSFSKIEAMGPAGLNVQFKAADNILANMFDQLFKKASKYQQEQDQWAEDDPEAPWNQ